jgi:LacI family transcriptional regulator, galactose operon repressor
MSRRAGLWFTLVLLDFASASRDLAKHLFDLGHRRIGTILGTYPAPPLPYEVHEQRFEEVYAYYNAQGCSLDPAYHVLCETSLAGGYEAACRLLDLDPRPTAIFAINDLLATAVLKAAHERGLRVPQDLSVAGCDNTELGQFYRLTTMDTAPKARAEETLEILQRVVIDGEATGKQIVRRSAARLLIRDTTGPAPS